LKEKGEEGGKKGRREGGRGCSYLINGHKISYWIRRRSVHYVDNDTATLDVSEEGEAQAWREGGRAGEHLD